MFLLMFSIRRNRSTIISHYAAQNKKLNAFCIRFKDKNYDEGKYAKGFKKF